MYYGNIKNCDIADGLGVRVTLFVSGCTHHCPGCFQPETWDFKYGEPYTRETEDKLIEMLAPGYIDGLTLLGGEPMEPENQRALLPLLRRVRDERPGKNVWCYTGYMLESDLLDESRARCEVTDELLGLIDVLVDGEFVQEKKDISLAFRGSENQRVIDLGKTLREGRVILLDNIRR
ncbi:MAG: anaerobic ribonucleoside-triphosphate reductase activating protein [Butyricicoccus sp.]|nr:anaerobic ribonucleoside-triphosphate reductase activating protein [Butyricicoccus sp.]